MAYFIYSNDWRAEVGRSQKIRSARILQVMQLSMMSSPYGDNINDLRVTLSRGLRPDQPVPGPHCSHGQGRVTHVTQLVSARPRTLRCDWTHIGL